MCVCVCVCVCVCLFCLQVDLVCCLNVQIYIYMLELVISTQLSMLITGLLTPNYAYNDHRNISKIADQSQPVNPRMPYVVLTVTSSGCLQLYLNPWRIGVCVKCGSQGHPIIVDEK